MYGLSWTIRSKPEWQRKMSDPAIMEKWRKEALDQQDGLPVEQKLTKNMVRKIYTDATRQVFILIPPQVNYVLSELAGYARLSDPPSGIEVR